MRSRSRTVQVSGQPVTVVTNKSVLTIDGVADSSITLGAGGTVAGSPFMVKPGGLSFRNQSKARTEVQWRDSIWFWQANGRHTQFVRADKTLVGTVKRRELTLAAPPGSPEWILAVLTFAAGVPERSQPIGFGGVASGVDGVFQIVAVVCAIAAGVAFLLARF
jgi:hypothetical protein